MKKIIALLSAAALLVTASAFASNPSVPIEVAIKGRQAVTDHLNHQIDHVRVKFSGNSVVVPGWQDTTMDLTTLRNMGYIHDGSFAEFSQAIYNIAFSGDVVPTPNGYYDVRAAVEVFNVNGETVLIGNGYLNVYHEKFGGLAVTDFEPYLGINENIDIVVPGDADAAKWVGQNGNARELGLSWDGQGRARITISSSLLENGFLLYTRGGHIVGYDLRSGDELSGKRIYALLGATRSGDTEVLRDPAKIDSGYYLFSQYGDMVVGRFPLRDVVLSEGKKFDLNFSVPVWGSAKKLAPTRIWVKQLYSIGGSKLEDGVEYEIPFGKGGFPEIYLPAGEFIIRTEFEGLMDWEELNGTYGIGKGLG